MAIKKDITKQNADSPPLKDAVKYPIEPSTPEIKLGK